MQQCNHHYENSDNQTNVESKTAPEDIWIGKLFIFLRKIVANDEKASGDEFSKKITKFPYNGTSKNLIDKFIILGYNISTILKAFPDFYKEHKEEIEQKQSCQFEDEESEKKNFLK